jgi:DNA-binding transcriptional LysR family regulator
MVELRHLRYFLAVVDAGSITRGAHAVRVAQPSLSRQLRQLEDEVGEKLFDRSAGRARLTAAGQVFVPLARDLVGRADRAKSIMRGLAEPDQLSLRLVAPEVTVADIVAPFLALLPTESPVIDVREALPAAVYAEVIAGAADVGITSGPPPRQLGKRLIVHFPIWAYVHAGHRWAGRHSIDVTELAEEQLIVLGLEHGTRRLMDTAMADAGVSYGVAAETNVTQVAQALAASRRGVAVVSDDARYDLHGLRIREADGTEMRVPLFGAWDPSHYGAAAIETLVAELARYSEDRYLPSPR